MFRLRLLSAGCTAFLLLLLFPTCSGRKNHICAPSSCGNIRNISYPFRLQTDPKHCGHGGYILNCENNITVLYLYSGKYYVQEINYNNFTIRLVDAGVRKDNCSCFPDFSLAPDSFSYGDSYTYAYGSERESQVMIFLGCSNLVNSPLYVDTASCDDGVNSSNSGLSHLKGHSYVIVGTMSASEFVEHCSIERMALLPVKDYKNKSFKEIHSDLVHGFDLYWYRFHCTNCKAGCYLDSANQVQCYHYGIFLQILNYFLTSLSFLGMLHASITLCGSPCVVAFLVYKWRRRHLSVYDTVEEFLQNHNNLMPVRYSYSDIKRMTKGFTDKLGEGGFGSVYKGKLRSGHFAAIKMLGKSKANGQDFINEVATIGRIHHGNVVPLIGFCAEGSKRALVYDFMPNGSLDKYIFSREGSMTLSWEKLSEISLGVARGIEYLHRGCDMQILHFDIKPHNILLDENFIPKVSDFGLAKLYSRNDSIASLTAARGTIGYMAPELFYKNIGRVSYKADVYSFGMLLLEMAGKRKNLNALAENSSQIYFPFWVHDLICNGKPIAIGDATEEENIIAKKMIIVGLWCIQMNPTNRPPMNKVVEMLEGDLESLELPPRPVLYPEEQMTNHGMESSSMSVDSVESSSSITEEG